MIIFGSSIVWHEWKKKKRKKNKALRSLDCCNLEYHPGRPEFICEFKKKKGIWKEMWLLDDGTQRERNWKEREAEWSKMSTEKRGKKGQTLKKKKSTGARGRERVKHMEWHEGWDDSQFCSDTSVESQTLTQSACHHRLLMDTQYWIHTPALHSDAVPHCRHLAFN